MPAPKSRGTRDQSFASSTNKADSARALAKKNRTRLTGARVYDLKDLKSRGVRLRPSQLRTAAGTTRIGTQVRVSESVHADIQNQLKK